MKWLSKSVWLLGLSAALSLILVSTAAAEGGAKALFGKRCSMCHPTSRALGKQKSGKEWRQTVLRMQLKAGERISDEEAEIIIKYLTETRGR